MGYQFERDRRIAKNIQRADTYKETDQEKLIGRKELLIILLGWADDIRGDKLRPSPFIKNNNLFFFSK